VIVAIALLAAIAFLVFQLLSGPGTPTEPTDVTVPNFVGRTLVDATTEADGLGLTLVPTQETSDQPVGTILARRASSAARSAPSSPRILRRARPSRRAAR
jgi:beta-lactam-binding protein with PASTA domain